MGRLLVISNRLPFSVTQDGEKISLRQSSGGLVSAIKSYFENDKESAKSNITQKIWVGLGDFTREEWKELEPDYERKDFEVVPLFVDPDTYSDYYNGFSNSTLWPLFHYFPSLAEYNAEHFEAYKKVNELFAETLIPVIQPDDIIWIHDYQLMLLPQLIRKAFPDALIGFFLHIPFPSYEIFRLIPTEWKRSLLTGLLGADLIGFHTHDYVQYFIQSVKMVLGLDNTYNTIHYQHRLVKADLFPIGIDYAKFRDATNDKEIISIRDEIRNNFSNKKIIFSVDRLDYSKGLMDRLQGFECFLERFPEWKERVVFIVNVVPSRDSIQTYNDRKRLIEEKISIINGLNATLSWQPVIYRYNHLEFKELSALYQAADVALITPLRDGMNLVAKEYVASCTSQRGVLILSELAGAASELSEAILVNPTDVMEVSSAIQKALTMPLTEQRYRMILMQKRLMDYDVFHWVNDFFEQLNLIKAEQRKMKVKVLDSETEEILRKHYTQAKKRCILLDYDGTLSPFTRLPADAIPGADLKTLLLELASDPKNNVVVISGRDA
ncbi:MAG TPA: bifunctional alpha,alpha-trehalose-phosphate synthase (UDP-forming)/trehalose-phosphatase, partial [Parasegetibacter sp.]